MHERNQFSNDLGWWLFGLFETDRQKMPHRIAEAERAILGRVKDLFFDTTDHIEEDQVLDDALYALRALRNWVISEPKAA